MSDSVRINGIVHSWSSVKFKIDGRLYTGLTAIEFGDSIEKVHAYGMGKHHAPRGQTRGKYVPKPFVCTGPTATIEAIRADLAQSAGNAGLSSVSSRIVVQISEPNDGPPILVEALESSLTENDNSHEENPDPLSEKISFLPNLYKRNGRTLFDNSEGTR